MKNPNTSPAVCQEDYDVLSSSRYFLEHESREAFRYVLDDARTAIFEAITAYGHLSVTESRWDDDLEGFRSHGVPIRDILDVSGSCDLPLIEHQRRQYEHHEELFIEQLFTKGELNEETALLTISPFPDSMTKKRARALGYRPDNKKYMLRWVEVEGDTRRTKQLSMSGSDVDLFNRLYRHLGYLGEDEYIEESEFLDRPILLSKAQVPNVGHIAKILDKLCDGDVGFGEEGASADYVNLEAVSRNREKLAEEEIRNFADQLISFSRMYSAKDALAHYKESLTRTVAMICVDQPELADQSIGKKSANWLKKMKSQLVRGNDAKAFEYFEQAINDADELFACGMSIGDLKSKNGAEAKTGILPCVTCPFCNEIVDAVLTADKIFCPECGEEAPR